MKNKFMEIVTGIALAVFAYLNKKLFAEADIELSTMEAAAKFQGYTYTEIEEKNYNRVVCVLRPVNTDTHLTYASNYLVDNSNVYRNKCRRNFLCVLAGPTTKSGV